MEARTGQRKLFKILGIIAVVVIAFILNFAVSLATVLVYGFIYAIKGGNLMDSQGLMEIMTSDPSVLLFSSSYNLLAIALVYAFWRFIDKQDKSRLGFSKTANTGKQIFWGIFAAVAAVAAIILIGTLSGIISFNSIGTSNYAVPQIIVAMFMGLITFLLVGFGEEAVYRSYVQNHIVDMLGTKVGLSVAALIFMIAHLGTYAKPLDLLDVFIAGIILGYAFVLTNSIYLPAAFHFMWDFLQLSIFRLQNYEYYKGPVLLLFNNSGDLVINNYNLGNKLEVVFILVELLILALMYFYRKKIASLRAS